ncbi:kinetochore protein SPC24 homolog [Apium graveolens]|uniref:kinetochore protein SPC24 homolog n=1 Tax=Apium graveolens TaxID=4045 RepID=UPI003D7AB7F2
MGEAPRSFDMKNLISYSDDLIKFLKSERDSSNLSEYLEQSNLLMSQTDGDFKSVETSILDYQKKLDLCNQKIDAAKSEVAADSELDMLQKELEEEAERERFLIEELRTITSDINDLEHQRGSIEERRESLRKLEKHELRAQMKLSMYASVTNVIPKLNEQQSTISGHIVERENKVVQNFEFDPLKMSPYDTCNRMWKMINL